MSKSLDASGIPQIWRPAHLAIEAARRAGMELIDAYLAAGAEFIALRKKLSAQGARNDLSDDPQGWREGCKVYLGISHDTARRWIMTANALAFLKGIVEGRTTEFDPKWIGDSKSTKPIPVDDFIIQQAQERLQAVASGDCSPHRALGAFSGGITGGTQTNATGRTAPDPVEQLTLDFDGLDKHAEHFGVAWQRWEPTTKLAAKATLRKLLISLPADLKAEAARWLSEKGER